MPPTVSTRNGSDRDVIQVRVRQEDVVDLLQLGERQIAHAGAGIDQHVVVEQHRGGAQVAADAAAATENPDLHGYLVSKS